MQVLIYKKHKRPKQMKNRYATLSLIITQQSVLLLCKETSALVYILAG